MKLYKQCFLSGFILHQGIIILIGILIVFSISLPGIENQKVKKDSQNNKKEIYLNYELNHLDENSKKQLNHFINVINTLQESDYANGNSTLTSESINKIGELISTAAKCSGDKMFRTYLLALVENLKEGKGKFPLKEWLDLKDNKLDMILALGGKKKKSSLYLLVYKSEKTDWVNKLIKLTDHFSRIIYKKKLPIGLDLSLIPSFRVADIIYASQYHQSALVFPPSLDDKVNYQYKVIVFHNLLEAYYHNVIVPLGQHILDKKLFSQMDFTAFFGFYLTHRLSHYLAPVLVKSGDKGKVKKMLLTNRKLKKLFLPIEEIRADVQAAYHCPLLKEKEMIAVEEAYYAAYLLTLFERVIYGESKDEKLPYLFQLNYLFEAGAVVYNINNQTVTINNDKINKTLLKLVGQVQTFFEMTDQEGVREILEKYDSESTNVKELLKRIRGLPSEFVIRSKLNK